MASESEASEAATEAYPGPEGFLEAVEAERPGHWSPEAWAAHSATCVCV